MKKLVYHSIALLIFLGLINPLNCRAQDLKGSFGKTSHFYEKCSTFTEELSLESTHVAWSGERISQVIVVWAEGGPLDKIQINCKDFTSNTGSKIDSELLQIRSVTYVNADHESRPCGEFTERDRDQLFELGDVLNTTLETFLQPGCPNIYWLTMDLPPETSPGIYKGLIQVAAGQRNTLELTLSLEVTGLTLAAVPEWSFHLDLWQFPTVALDRYNETYPEKKIDYWSEEHFSLLRNKYLPLAHMGQKVITAHIKEGALGSPSMIRWLKKTDHSWAYDFRNFDSYVDSMMTWGIKKQISCQSPVGWNSEVIPYWCEEENRLKELAAPVGSDTYQERWDHFLTAFQTHLEKKDWLDKTVLYLDEIDSENLAWILHMIKSNNPRWRIGLAGFNPLPEALENQIYDLSMMLGRDSVPLPIHGETIRTFYTSCNPPRPNNFLVGDADPAENIWVAWHAMAMGYEGFLRWAYDYWIHPDPGEQRIGRHTSGDFSLSYRSSNDLSMRTFSSVRLELLREGIEDYEKIIQLIEILRHTTADEDHILQLRLMEMIERFRGTNATPPKAHRLISEAHNLLDEISTHF